jgi:TetR/AcrR family transcriptional regulator of autoinduction and epiphytic fitness
MSASVGTVDPRVERSRRVILDATLDELADVGYGALTIEGVARRANVGKATVYRHWDGKLELVGDAITTLKQSIRPPDVDDPRARIVGLLNGLAGHLFESQSSACLPAIIDAAERDEAVRRFHHRSSSERRAALVALLREAVARGHLAPDLDLELLAESLVGPLFLRRLMTPDPFPPERIGELVDLVLGPHWSEPPRPEPGSRLE